MNDLIIENADTETTALFKSLAKKLGLRVKTKIKKKEKGLVDNADLLERMRRIEEGNVELISTNIEDLRKLLNA